MCFKRVFVKKRNDDGVQIATADFTIKNVVQSSIIGIIVGISFYFLLCVFLGNNIRDHIDMAVVLVIWVTWHAYFADRNKEEVV